MNDVASTAQQALASLADVAHHVRTWHLTQEMRVQSALDDVGGNIDQALPVMMYWGARFLYRWPSA